ncbi:MAG: hypothetical protein RIS47_795, partial [Bacteroidota bacterium]
MGYTNNAMLIRRELIARLAHNIWNKNPEAIDRIPIEMAPKGSVPFRSSIHKDRAVMRYRLMALLGYDVADETDELKSLYQYAIELEAKPEKPTHTLTVVDEACSSCHRVNYFVSNICRGCLARTCSYSCKKDAISFRDGQALIDPKTCVNCGLCQKECPFHAIVFVPIPCEESCPVGAISQDERGIEQIDHSLCISCGKCVTSCPFGAIMSRSQVVPLIHKLRNREAHTTAMVAPAIWGQFKSSREQLLTGLKALGFDAVHEVATGAEEVVALESKELQERLDEGAQYMTSSCCPAYVSLAEKHIPKLVPQISHTPSPMVVTARRAKQQNPDTHTIFIGPCIAKQQEALQYSEIDHVINFEELGALFVARGINLLKLSSTETDTHTASYGNWFAAQSGLTQAITHHLQGSDAFRPMVINGINKANIRELKNIAAGRTEANFVEVMAC